MCQFAVMPKPRLGYVCMPEYSELVPSLEIGRVVAEGRLA